jgi:hypothetical protein
MKMDDEELYVLDDLLEEASAQMLPRVNQKELEKFTSE